jgi:bacteriocin-like protein
MLATDQRCAEIGNADARKRSGKRKQNKQMEKFKELSIEEMQEVDGGGPVREWFCKKTREFVEWWNSTEDEADPCAVQDCVLV